MRAGRQGGEGGGGREVRAGRQGGEGGGGSSVGRSRGAVVVGGSGGGAKGWAAVGLPKKRTGGQREEGLVAGGSPGGWC